MRYFERPFVSRNFTHFSLEKNRMAEAKLLADNQNNINHLDAAKNAQVASKDPTVPETSKVQNAIAKQGPLWYRNLNDARTF